jgi:serine/threonine-protein kinase
VTVRDLTTFVDEVIREASRLTIDEFLSKLPAEVAPGSLGSGAGGVALFFYELARRRSDGDAMLTLAAEWCEHAEAQLELRPAPRPEQQLAFAFGAAGVGYLRVLVGHRQGDDTSMERGTMGLVRSWEKAVATAPSTDLFGGAAGFVCAMHRLLRLDSLPSRTEHALRGMFADAVGHLKAALERPLVARSGHARSAMAHGVGGELLALLPLVEARPLVAERLGDLAKLVIRDDELVAWPVLLGARGVPQTAFGSWCNGIAGMTHLWCRAYEALRDPMYLRLATDSATTTFRALEGVPTVCCGTAGQAAVLDLYSRVAGEVPFRRRALDRMRRAIRDATSLPPILLQGKLGIALVALGLAEHHADVMPAFDVVR